MEQARSEILSAFVFDSRANCVVSVFPAGAAAAPSPATTVPLVPPPPPRVVQQEEEGVMWDPRLSASSWSELPTSSFKRSASGQVVLETRYVTPCKTHLIVMTSPWFGPVP